MATRIDRLQIRLEQEGVGRVRASLSGVSDELGSLESRLAAIGRTARAAGAALLAGFSLQGVVSAIREVTAAAAEAERAEARVEAIIRATGQAAGITAREVSVLAESLAALTRFDDEELREAAATLLTFRNISRETFGQALQLAADVAVVFRTDLRSAAQQVGRALNDPVEGFTALQRLGVQLSDAQRELASQLMATNRAAEAQKIVTDELARAVGGAAAGENVGLAKATSDATKAWNDFLEAIGRTPGVSTSVNAGLGVAANLLRAMTQALENTRAEFERQAGLRREPPRRLDSGGQFPGFPELEGLSAQEIEERARAAEAREKARREEEAARQRAMNEQSAKNRNQWELFKRKTEHDAFVQWQRDQEARERLEDDLVESQRRRINAEYDDLRVATMNRLKLLEEEYAEKRRIVQEYLSWHPEAQAEANQILLDLENKYQAERAEIERQANESIISLRFAVIAQLAGLLQTIAGQSKAAAIAVIAIEKGLAIAQTIMNTQVAAMRALAELGPIAGPPMAAKIKALGQISVGIIAATGFLQAANVGAGGAALGTPGNPIITQPPATPIFDPNEQRGAGSSIVVQFLGPVLGEEEFVRTRMAPILRELIENEQLVIITSGSRQAQELLDA